MPCLECKKLLWTLRVPCLVQLEHNWHLSSELIKFERPEYGYTYYSRTGVCYMRLSCIQAHLEYRDQWTAVEEPVVSKVTWVGCEISLVSCLKGTFIREAPVEPYVAWHLWSCTTYYYEDCFGAFGLFSVQTVGDTILLSLNIAYLLCYHPLDW